MKAKWEITSLYKKKRIVLKAVVLVTILVKNGFEDHGHSQGRKHRHYLLFRGNRNLGPHQKARWFCRDAEQNEEGAIVSKKISDVPHKDHQPNLGWSVSEMGNP